MFQDARGRALPTRANVQRQGFCLPNSPEKAFRRIEYALLHESARVFPVTRQNIQRSPSSSFPALASIVQKCKFDTQNGLDAEFWELYARRGAAFEAGASSGEGDVGTVMMHVRHLYMKMEVHSQQELIDFVEAEIEHTANTESS